MSRELNHENVVKCYGAGVLSNNTKYLILEWMESSLYTFWKSNPKMNANQICCITSQIAAGLSYMHSKNVLHRDIKLGNILLKGPIVKIADFGLSTYVPDLQAQNEPSSVCQPKYYKAYQPPEIEYNKWTKEGDIYSFGVLIWELYHSKLAYKGYSNQEIHQSKKNKESLPIEKQGNEKMEQIITNCMAIDYQARPTIDQLFRKLTKMISDSYSFEGCTRSFEGYKVVLLLGRLGAGKSYLGNKIINGKCFKSSNKTESGETTTISYGINEHSKTIVIDTPGLGDSGS